MIQNISPLRALRSVTLSTRNQFIRFDILLLESIVEPCYIRSRMWILAAELRMGWRVA